MADDFNHDGIIDLAVVSECSNDHRVLWGETIRDDLSQADIKRGRRVVNLRDAQAYLGEQIAEVRQL